jgi:hypothetical protein
VRLTDPHETSDVRCECEALALPDGRYAFGGVLPGTYDLWIDIPGRAPVIHPAVKIDPRGLDLGVLKPGGGAEVRIHCLLPAGRSPPPLVVTAIAATHPSYQRRVSFCGEDEIILRGLGPGSFRLFIQTANAPVQQPCEMESIDSDGRTPIDLLFDLR